MHITRICQRCGAKYWTSNGKAKYCSDECRIAAHREKQKQWRDNHPDYFRNRRSSEKEKTAADTAAD